MSDTQQKPNPKRRWLTYSLRSFFLVVTIACVAFGFWASSAAKQKAAVEWVKANGGTVYYDFELDDDDEPPEWSGKTPIRPYPKWAATVLGDDYFANVVSVQMHSSDLKEIEPLAALNQLKVLDIIFAQVSDLTPLANLANLEILSIDGTQVSDLTPLAKLTRLKCLKISGMQVVDLTPLARLTRLKLLWIYNMPVNDLTPLNGLTSLQEVIMLDTRVSDLTPFAKLIHLEILSISGTKVTDLTPLAKLSRLAHGRQWHASPRPDAFGRVDSS